MSPTVFLVNLGIASRDPVVGRLRSGLEWGAKGCSILIPRAVSIRQV